MLKKLQDFTPFKKLLKEIKVKNSIYCSNLYGSAKTIFGTLLYEKGFKIIILLPLKELVDQMEVEFTLLGYEKDIVSISEFSNEVLQEKIVEILKREKLILISTYSLLNVKAPGKDIINKNITTIEIGGDLGYSGLLEYLNILNFVRNRYVETPGEYAQRGAIIDFWSFSEKFPIRIEFDGDFVETIKSFDPESQRSISKLERATISPLIEENPKNAEDDCFSSFIDLIENPVLLVSEYDLMHYEWNKENGSSKKSIPETKDYDDKLFEDIFPEISDELAEEMMLQNNLESNFDISVYTSKPNTKWIIEKDLLLGDEILSLNLKNPPAVNSNFNLLFNIILGYIKNDFRVFITAENQLQTNRIKELIDKRDENENEETYRYTSNKISNQFDDLLNVVSFPIREGFVSQDDNIAVMTDYQLFNKPYRMKLPKAVKHKKARNIELTSIVVGDFVVHEDYGIGKYVGLESIQIGDIKQESMKLLYNDGGTVYVNLNYFHLVKKYSSKDTIPPRLSSLGSPEWQTTKRKTKRRIKETARELIELYAKRISTQGFSFGEDTIWQKELEASFIYEDTPDQSRASEEVKNDLAAFHPMDRLVCGDVGFGKTEVAIRAAFKVVQQNKQVAILVPTTILAEQHFNTFKDRLSQFPVKVAVLSRFQSKYQQSLIVKDLSLGNYDIVVGTHRLLSKDLKFKDLGLLIIDEEHRFGVAAKEKLKSLKLNVDALTLTATPIPRTLNLSLLGARDLSIIATPPPNRQPIYTKIEVFNPNRIKEWVYYELNRNGQVYIVHDRVRSIEQFCSYLKKYMPSVKFVVAHGQMKATQLEAVFHDFMNKKYDVIISTKIIESGLDIPNVNTIIINRADRFGLAELHQLRGRVGRADRQAYAYLLVPSLEALNKKTVKRLQAIEELSELGSGFNLSMRDLEIRGAGNLLGYEQSGFINEVGFDLYVKLINEAVEELKNEEFKDVFRHLPKNEMKTDPTIDTFFEVGIPKTYMPDQMDRLSFYTALYSVNNLQELEDLKEEMEDRFGKFSILVQRLFDAATLKYYAALALFEKVVIQRKIIIIVLPNSKKEEYYDNYFNSLIKYLYSHYGEKIKFSQQNDVFKLIINNQFVTAENMLDFLINFAKEIINLLKPETGDTLRISQNENTN